MSSRSTREVIESHLALAQAGDLEGDIATNYADDVVLLSTGEGVNHGHDGIRRLARILDEYLPAGRYEYQQVLVEGDVAMLRWGGAGDDRYVEDGIDSFVVRDGVIVAQTIHFTTRPREG